MASTALAVLTIVLSLGAVGLLRNYLQDRWMDIPNQRSSHTRPTPRGGGLGFVLAFTISLGIAQYLNPSLLSDLPLTLWLSLLPLVIIGILDDHKNVPSGIRYIIQLGTASAIVAYCGPFPQPWFDLWGVAGAALSILLTVIGFTALINFYNFMDGLDGLVAGIATVQLGFLAFWCNQPVLWLLAASLLGFLYWNWSPAKIFMGDSGSTFLGAAIALVLLTQPHAVAYAWAGLAILFPLVGDAIYTLSKRLLKGDNIFQAHRTHIYQRLHHQAGWAHDQVALVYISLTGLAAVSLHLLGLYGAIIVLVANGLLIYFAERYLSRPAQTFLGNQD